MGNWALRWAVQAQFADTGGLPAIDQMILAAADEDDDTLSQPGKLQPIIGACKRVSVYCNRYDRPLFASDRKNGYGERLGQYGPTEWQTLPDTVKTISAATVSDGRADWELHQYYRMNPYVRHDIQQVLQGIADGQVRSLLDKRIGDAVTVAVVAEAVRAAKSLSISSRIAFN
jgi:esterase/lipase superfamily enzyme